MVRTLPVIPVTDGGRIEVQPLWYEDLGRGLARAVEAPDADGKVLHAAGPERVPLSKVIDRLCVILGRHPTRLSVPGLLATMGAEAASMLGLPLPARAAALVELDGEATLRASIENALTTVLGVTPTLLDEGLRKLVADVPEQTPSAPGPTLRRREFRVAIEGSSRAARELRDEFRRTASQVLGLVDGPPEGPLIKKGTLLSAAVPLRGHVTLRVAEVARDSVTAVTVEGGPLAGLITFRFLDRPEALEAAIVVEAAAATPLDRVLASAADGALEDFDWPGALERLVALSGGRAPAGIERTSVTLDEEEADRVRQRAERLRLMRQRSRAPARSGRSSRTPSAGRRAEAARAPQPRRDTRVRSSNEQAGPRSSSRPH